MKTIYVITILFLSTINTVYSQAQKNNTDIITIHKLIVELLKEEGNSYQVSPQTSKELYKKFDFNTPYDTIDQKTALIWKQEDWKNFLTEIDTANTTDYRLNTRGKNWLKKTDTIENNQVITFAPLLISKDGSKALSIVSIKGKVSGSVIVFYLEKGSVWKKLHSTTISFSEYQ